MPEFQIIRNVSKMIGICGNTGKWNKFGSKTGLHCITRPGSTEDFPNEKVLYAFQETKKVGDAEGQKYSLEATIGFPAKMNSMAIYGNIIHWTGPNEGDMVVFCRQDLINFKNQPGRSPIKYLNEDSEIRLFHMLAANCLPIHALVWSFNRIHEKGSLILEGIDRLDLNIELMGQVNDVETREVLAEEIIENEISPVVSKMALEKLTAYMNKIRNTANTSLEPLSEEEVSVIFGLKRSGDPPDKSTQN